MSHLGLNLGFFVKSLDDIRVTEKLRVNNLKGNNPVEGFMNGFIYFSHAAYADAFYNFIIFYLLS